MRDKAPSQRTELAITLDNANYRDILCGCDVVADRVRTFAQANTELIDNFLFLQREGVASAHRSTNDLSIFRDSTSREATESEPE
jgi:hypothetical protein